MLHHQHSIEVEDEHPHYDVFISYRRSSGADFAQLLKVQFMSNDITAFLDTDNIGTGKFTDTLVNSISTAKNIVLVFTKGCMDRFLDG